MLVSKLNNTAKSNSGNCVFITVRGVIGMWHRHDHDNQKISFNTDIYVRGELSYLKFIYHFCNLAV